MATITVTQFTVPEVLEKWSSKTGAKMTQSDLARALGMTRQQIGQLKDKPLPQKYMLQIQSLFNTDSSDCIAIQHIHIKPSCGSGTAVLDEPEVTPIMLGKKLIESVLRVSDVKNLRTFTASGDSMQDTIDDGNLLLVDIGRLDYNNGGVFLIQNGTDWFIKRLRLRLTGELEIISDNPKYGVEVFKPTDNVEIKIQGRVIKNLSKGL